MKLSLNWIKQYTDVDMSVDELVAKIGAQLGEVENVENLGAKYAKAVVVKVVTCQQHPNADRLKVCAIDDGGTTPDVKRNADNTVQVVCGASNVTAGATVVWLPPGATVPNSFDIEPFVLEARELRGVVSDGMLASPKELNFGDDHDGLLLLDDDKQPGTMFAEAYELNDHIIDIENKMFTHRPDLFGELGLAREVAGINQQKFTSPEWYTATPQMPPGSGLDLAVVNEATELVPRFTTLTIKNVVVKPSPLWLQSALVRLGAKSINNVVDASNYIMLMTAQPSHAYDYKKLRGATLMTRLAKPDEKLTLLNHKTYSLHPDDIVIADAEGAVGLAGVMGGGDSEVTDSTTNLVLEVATFDMYAVRRSSMRHGLFTDAVTRFNKGQSPLQNAVVMQQLAQTIQEIAGGEIAGALSDISQVEGRQWVHPPVPVTSEFINTRLGLKLSPEAMKSLLENVEFVVQTEGAALVVTAPFWRTDIETREDVVEEIGRLHGYDNLPLELPKRSIKPAHKNALLQLKDQVRDILATAGGNEVLTYSFVHGNLLDKAGQDSTKAFKVGNALSPDLQYYRQSLTASLLDKVHPNLKSGYDQFALFELGKGHNLDHADDDDGLPMEFDMLEVVFAANSKVASDGAAYYQTLALLNNLCQKLGLEIELKTIENEEDYPVAKPYDHTRSAQVWLKGGKLRLGMIGEYKASVRRGFKLPEHTAGFGLGLMQLQQAMAQTSNTYRALPRYPKVSQDLTLRVPASTKFADVEKIVAEAVEANKPAQTLANLQPLGVYRAEGESTKNISWRLTIASYDRTLTDAEISSLLGTAADAASQTINAEKV